MKRLKLNARGFGHYVLFAVIGVAAVTGLVFLAVLRAHTATKANAQTALSSSASKGTLSSNAQPEAGASTLASPPSQSTTPATSTQVKSKTTSGSTTVTSGSSNTPNSTPQPKPTPLSVLTDLITSLNNGGAANVTASNVNVPAAVSGSVSARPIVFTANGTTYFAYTRVNPPYFNTSASTTASSMAIVPATGTYSLVSAHVGKTGYLTGPNSEYVGYTPSNN